MNELRCLVAIMMCVACASPGPSAPLAERSAPSASPIVPPPSAQPARVYNEGGPPVPIDPQIPDSTDSALSPDGMLLARAITGGVAFYDVDREIVVGRTWLHQDNGVQALRWFGDTTLAGATGSGVITFDGRTGAVRHVAPGSFIGYLDTQRGPAFVTVAGDEPPASFRVAVRLLDAPSEVLFRATIAAELEAVLVGPGDGFLVVTELGASLHDVNGKTRWKVDQEVDRLGLDPRTGAALWIETRTEVLDATTATPQPVLTAHVRGRNSLIGKAPPPPPAGVPDDAIEVTQRGGYRLQTRLDDALREAASPLTTETRSDVLSVIDRKSGARHVVGRVGDYYRSNVSRGGRFVTLVGDRGTRFFRTEVPSDEPLVSLPGACQLGLTEADVPRVALCEQGDFDLRGAGTPGFSPKPIGRTREARYETTLVTAASDAAFIGRCGALEPVTLGSPTPVVLAQPEYEDPGFRTSPDGQLLATYGPPVDNEYRESPSQVGTSKHVELARTADKTRLRMIDQGELVQYFAFHPSGTLVVAGATKVKLWSPHDGKLERTLDGSNFAFSADGRWLFVWSPRSAAIYEWSNMRLAGRWSGAVRPAGLSESGASALLHEVQRSPATLSWYTVGLRVVDLRSRRTRFSVPSDERGFAFSSDEAAFALAPAPAMEIPFGPVLASRIDVRDVVSGRTTESLAAPEGAENPFFVKGSAFVGFHGPGYLRLTRRSGGASVDVRAFARGDRCHLYAVDTAGSFDGDPSGGLGYRLGDDLRTSAVVMSGPRFEAFRKIDLVSSFLEGR